MSDTVTMTRRVRRQNEKFHRFTQPAEMFLESEPFAQGGMRRAYHMRLAGFVYPMVAKEFISQHECIGEEELDVVDAAQEMAALFNAQSPPRPVHFLSERWFACTVCNANHRFVFVIHRPNVVKRQPLFCEPYLDGLYQKHNCASGWLPQRARHTPQAFSHFTFCATKGQMLIVDLQGVGDMYTDPVVLTRDGHGFGLGNIGQKGMDDFFASHRCNHVCIQLGLHPAFGPLDTDSSLTPTVSPSK